MARATTQPTNSQPWLASFTAADADLSSSGANAPVELSIPPDSDFVRLSFSSDVDVDAGTGAFWHLLGVDSRVLEDESEPTVFYAREFETENSPFTQDRLSHFDGGGGRFMHQLAGGGQTIFDIRGMTKQVSRAIHWYLALVNDSSTMTTLYLNDFSTWKRRPS